MAIYRLEQEHIWFPDPDEAEAEGLLALGGDLSPDRLLLAYQHGIFPWYNPGEEILWWCPHDRFVILPGEIHVSRSLKKYLKRYGKEKDIRVSFNREFANVMHQCRMIREDGEGTWISDEMEEAYQTLHRAGYALSTEVYEHGQLVGGLYGVVIGTCYFGESMFSRTENASKIALVSLAKELEQRNFQFIDCQFRTEHLERMGGKYVSSGAYKEMLKKGIPGYGGSIR